MNGHGVRTIGVGVLSLAPFLFGGNPINRYEPYRGFSFHYSGLV